MSGESCQLPDPRPGVGRACFFSLLSARKRAALKGKGCTLLGWSSTSGGQEPAGKCSCFPSFGYMVQGRTLMLLRRAASLKDGPYTGFCSLPTSFMPSPHYSTQWGFYKTSCLPLCPCMSSCMELSTMPRDTAALRQSRGQRPHTKHTGPREGACCFRRHLLEATPASRPPAAQETP